MEAMQFRSACRRQELESGTIALLATMTPPFTIEHYRIISKIGQGGMGTVVAPDGKRFLVFPIPEKDRETARTVHAFVLLNSFDELRRRVPAP